MTNEKRLTTAERLELHNLATLVKSASAKRAAGKPLTKREIAAVEELEQRQADAKSAVAATGLMVSAGPVVRLLMRFASTADEELIREALGDAAAHSIPQAASIFGVSQATVRNGWRRDGMPGTTRRGPGQRSWFPLADVVLWCLHREEAASQGRRRMASSNGADKAARAELDAIELESARVDLEIKRAKLLELQSDMVHIGQVRAECASFMTNCRDKLLELPSYVKPMLPAKVAEEVASEMDRLIRIFLHALVEQLQGVTDDKERDDQSLRSANDVPEHG